MMSFLRGRLFAPVLAWREGNHYARYLRPLRRELRDVSDPAFRERLQIERTADIIAHAYTHSPYYRDFFDTHGFHPSQFKDLRDLKSIPPFEKRFIPGQQDRVLARNIDRRDLIPTATGGTTGNAFAFWYDRACFARRHALTQLANETYGWRPGDPVAYVWNAHQDLPEAKPSRKQRLRAWLSEPSLFLDASHINEEMLARGIRLFRQRRIEILYGYAHSLAAFAEYCDQMRISLPDVRLVVSTAEPLFAADRRLIERAFCCPVRDRYASREHGPMAQEADDGRLRYFANSILLESTAAPGTAGDVLVTDYWNRAFPFIRYHIGDTCLLEAGAGALPGLPPLGRLTGRQTDFLLAADGTRVSGMSFHQAYVDPETGACGTDDFLAIQFIQKDRSRLLIRCVPGPSYAGPRVTANLERLVHQLLGESTQIEIEEVTEIARTASGKYRFTINEIADVS